MNLVYKNDKRFRSNRSSLGLVLFGSLIVFVCYVIPFGIKLPNSTRPDDDLLDRKRLSFLHTKFIYLKV